MAGMTLKSWLAENGRTQDWLAEQLGSSQTNASRIIAGQNTSFDNLRRIHELTNGAVTPNWMVLGQAS